MMPRPGDWEALAKIELSCQSWCRAHRSPCILNAHAKTSHRCVKCPWPAAKKMVRRGSW